MHLKMEMNVCKRGSNEKLSELPGFRFHPTEQELVGFYLKRMVQGKLHNFNFIPMLDLYRYEPWDLSSSASLDGKELFFFVPRDERCQNNRGRPNRMTSCGYWKATGSDRSVHDDNAKCIGLKKTLVFYRGRAPRGLKTDWIMNEYRLPDYFHGPKKEVVLCRIYKKATPLKWLEQQAMIQAEDLDCISHDSPRPSAEIDDNKRNQEAKSICVRKSDSVACHEITAESSSSPYDKVAITSSLDCAVDSGLMESTVFGTGNFIDPNLYSAFADDCKRVEGFSSIMALLNSAPSPSSSSIECCWEIPAMAEEPRSPAQIPKLSIDFHNEEVSSDGNWNVWMELWSLSSI